MIMTSRPVTDYFGTRLSPDGLVAGLGALGLRSFTLVLADDGAVPIGIRTMTELLLAYLGS